MNDVESSLRAHLEDLVWQPPEDTLGRKRLQTQISLCFKELLKCTLCDDAKKRSWAFEVLQRTSQSYPEAAWLIANSGLLGEALQKNLDVDDHCEQERIFYALSLALVVASHVPENHVFHGCMPTFVGIASGTWHQQPFRAVQITTIHTLVHLCCSRISRRWINDAFTVEKVEALLEAAQRKDSEGRCVPEHTFQACMLLANLCDLHVVTVPKSPHLEGLEGPQTSTFGYFADEIWRAEEFFVSFAACMAASAKGEPWPPTSQTHWVPWKLTLTAERLARHGYAHDLRMSLVPLATFVVWSSSSDSTLDQPERTGRLAIEAVRSIASAAGDTERLRSDVFGALGMSFQKALQKLQEEHPAAQDLLDIFHGGQDPLPYLLVDLT